MNILEYTQIFPSWVGAEVYWARQVGAQTTLHFALKKGTKSFPLQ
jgi:hypothetical protein